MATLQNTFKDLREEVQRYLGYGRETGFDGLSAGPRGDVLVCIERGLRQFYNPAPLPNESSSHEWSFLRGEGVIATVAPYTTGTVTVNGVAVTGSGTTFTDAMIGRIFHANDEIREVAARGGAAAISLDRALETNITSASSYEIIANEYTLPSDFGGIKGAFTYRDGDNYVPLKLVNESAIRMLRSQGDIRKDVPEYAAIIPADVTNETTSAQGYKLTLFPFPDKIYDLYFAYTVMPNSPADDSSSSSYDNNVPLGGMVHSETILASCLTIAEQMVDEFNNPGKMQARYQERLAASISFDRRNMLPDGFGYNADNSDRITQIPSRRRMQTVTHRNVLYP
ncbi:MAG: hypothetical protein Unbinned3138contig1001_20 [Prokaryotic dsDNA virus sp.]|nr:MAG: hypothetical protein Unbinned3138contig1001_20 [Prokaryotic dsDNA virus sp.]|tara:strand:+ start:12862 stop:13878 length:1017 start_codon:yes stop_codon:yes gene_type:complete